jgi:hypothetical protein
MALTSFNSMVASSSSGKKWRWDWNKVTGGAAYTIGRWYDFSGLAGSPVANAWSGTALAHQATNDTTGFGIYHGGNVSTDVKQLVYAMAMTGVGTGVPGTIVLVDMQGYWPGINMNSAVAQTLTGTPTLRYANGAGCRLALITTATTGATAHNVALSYTNQAGTTGRTLPVTVACTPSAIVPHITHSGTSANNYGPFLPLASGDYGVQNVATLTLSAASLGGTAALALVRPLGYIQLATASIVGERDFVNQVFSMERIYDGACIVPFYFAGAATGASSNFFGALECLWG